MYLESGFQDIYIFFPIAAMNEFFLGKKKKKPEGIFNLEVKQ